LQGAFFPGFSRAAGFSQEPISPAGARVAGVVVSLFGTESIARSPMTPALLGKKVGMTRVYDDKGAVVPVTVVECQPNHVTQVKTVESDGYTAVQIGFGDCKARFSNF